MPIPSAPFFGMRDTEGYALYDAHTQRWRTGVGNEARIRPMDFLDAILMLYPDGETPMTALMALAKKRATTDPNIYWFTQTYEDREGEITGVFTDPAHTNAYAGGGQTGDALYINVPASTAQHFQESNQVMLVMNPDPDGATQELKDGDPRMSVTAVVHQVTVNGANSNISINLLEDDDNAPLDPNGFAAHDLQNANYIVCLGTVNPEGSGLPTNRLRHPVRWENRTQIFINSAAITGTAHKTKTRFATDGGFKLQNEQMWKEHAWDIERALLFSTMSERLGPNGHPQRTMQGLIPFITQSGGLVSDYRYENHNLIRGKTWFEGWFLWLTMAAEKIFQYGAGERMCWIGNDAYLALNHAIMNTPGGQFTWSPAIKAFGIRVIEMVTPFGTIYIRSHPMFRFVPHMRNSMVIFDPTDVIYRPLRPTKKIGPDGLQKHLGASWYDGIMNGVITETTLQYNHPVKCAILTGFGADNRLVP